MINPNQTIPCPVCNTGIPFDPHELVRGKEFSCPKPGCDSRVGIAGESLEEAARTIEEFEVMKTRLQSERNKHT